MYNNIKISDETISLKRKKRLINKIIDSIILLNEDILEEVRREGYCCIHPLL